MRGLIRAVGAAGGLWLAAAAALRARRRRATPALVGASARELALPAGLRLGAATSAHQVEGGTTDNNWTRWEQSRRPDGSPGIRSGERCGDAVAHWERFEDDLVRMRELGLEVYRFSIEWSRVEPAEGSFDAAALERYRSWCVRLREAGIEPMVTLHHFTEPLWVTDAGGWESPATVARFVRFAEEVAARLGDVVDLWITVNEPVVYAIQGWALGEWPPGKRDLAAAVRVLEHLLLAHAGAYRALHQIDAVDADGDGLACQVSLAKHVLALEPRRWWHPGDVLAAAALHRLFNTAPVEALRTGRLRLPLPGGAYRNVRHDQAAGTLDFLGVNHYLRFLVRSDPRAPAWVELGFDERGVRNDMGWELTPASLYTALRYAGGFGVPVVVTENGICDGEEPDRRRQRYLVEALHAIAAAARDGVDVRAYLYWSLLDNFEWTFGFGPRFGLYRVDRETLERRLTGGGALYRDAIAAARA